MKPCEYPRPMGIFPQPCVAPSESARLRAKQGHAKSAKAATNNHFPSFPSSQNQISNIKNQKSFPSRPWRPLREQSAFSLTEVVIAMGVAAVAFTSIIALFPLGLNMSKESYEATQSALIAQTIFADLKDQQTGAGNRRTPDPQDTRLFQISPNSDPMGVRTNYAEILIATATPQTAYIAYKPNDGANNDTDPNNPLIMRPYRYSTDSATADDWYKSGLNGAFALVKVTISPTLLSDTDGDGSPRRIDMSVETPGSANVSNRTCYLFTGAVKE